MLIVGEPDFDFFGALFHTDSAEKYSHAKCESFAVDARGFGGAVSPLNQSR